MKNLRFTTARVSSNRGGENVLDDVHFFVGEECTGGFSLQLLRVLQLSINSCIQFATLRPTKGKILFPIYENLYYKITLNIPTSFDPQGIIIRKSNLSNASQNQTSNLCREYNKSNTLGTYLRVHWFCAVLF
jgi:hypothetical protein